MKCLDQNQIKRFKKLYQKGYSASLIFEKLGQPYPKHKYYLANSRMRSYRIKLALPMRGINKSGRRRYPQPRISEATRIQQRMSELKQMIPGQQKKLQGWTDELARLEVHSSQGRKLKQK
jgi:hypothetical protein